MSSINKILKNIFNVNSVKINDLGLYSDYKGRQHLKLSIDLYKKDRCKCPVCHKKCSYYDYPFYMRNWRHLDLGGIISEMEMPSRRIKCKKHGVLLEAVPFAYKDSCFTKDFDLTIAFLARSTSIQFISEYMNISWSTVGRCVTRARNDLDPDLKRRFNNLVNIGIDETSYKKGHSYITVIVNHDNNEVVWLHQGHGKDVLSCFFNELDDNQRKSIKNISGDGAKWIDECIKEYVPNATRTVDSYHVVSWAEEALDLVRKEVWNESLKHTKELKSKSIKYSKGRPKKNDTERKELKRNKEITTSIKNSKYVLLKNPENLNEYQKNKLEMIANNNPKLYKSYLLKENLRKILHIKNEDVAKALLDEWLKKACHSKINEFVDLSRKIRRHKEHILNTIKTGLSNARIESINNKIKLIIRRAYGFRNINNMMNMIYLVCSSIKIPLPNRETNSLLC